jgi:hypothetical protein
MFSRSTTLLLVTLIFCFGLAAGLANAQPTASRFWNEVSPSAITPAGERVITPQVYRALSLDLDAIGAFLVDVPLQGTAPAANRATIDLPLPAGGFGRFSIVESPIMHPDLQARFPEIRTYAGFGIDDPTATVRFDLTPLGFHALILSANGTVYIDPYQLDDMVHYQSYYKTDFVSDKSLGGCTVLDDGIGDEIRHMVEHGELPRSGGTLRTYRTVVACTGEYAAHFGGTVPLALAAITTSMNRVNGVYERETAIHMELVANETAVIYTNASTDPYTNSDGAAMLSQNQTTCDNVIGTANYDMGHVFSTGGGGIARLGCVCRASLKAQGVTGSPSPHGDSYDIDYVAHEMGHQFGSNHCFNSVSSNCGGGNRNASTAYEPGSASTIMGYAGICPPDDLQAHSDDYFVWISLQEIFAYSQSGLGNPCSVRTPTGAVDPVAEAGVSGFYIPIRTPFTLTGSATTTGTPTFCWEESDLGPAGSPNSPSGNAPILRSFRPVTSPSRTFPKTSDLLNNVHTIGELLPTYARNLSFKVTVRDVQAGGVGVAWDGMSFSVAAVGPFTVLTPNTAITWYVGVPQTVTWDVGGTNASPVNCATVNILLSTDGGYTWPVTLATGTTNDGSEGVAVPDIPTTRARVKVEAVGNIFFDISNVNFIIENNVDVTDQTPTATRLLLSAARPNPFNPETTIHFQMPQAATVALRVYDPAGRLVRTLVDGSLDGGAHQAIWDGRDAAGRAVSSGVYLYELKSMDQTLKGRMTLIR